MLVVGFKILLFWYCLPKTIGFGGPPNLLLCELDAGLEHFANFARIHILMCFLSHNLA